MFHRCIIAFCTIAVSLQLASCATQPEAMGISSQQWQHYGKQEQQRILVNHVYLLRQHLQGQTKASSKELEVTIAGGKVMMAPFIKRYRYKPVTFKIKAGFCSHTRLVSVNVSKISTLSACYRYGRLMIDPSYYDLKKQYGSIRFYESPLWRNGFTYHHVNSSGYARLHNVTITVKFRDALKKDSQ